MLESEIVDYEKENVVHLLSILLHGLQNDKTT